MASNCKHTTCTLKDKLEAIKRLYEGESVSKLASELNVGKSTICDWKKTRAKIEQFRTTSAEKTLQHRQAAKQSLYGKVDESLFVWFTQERERETPLVGLLCKKR